MKTILKSIVALAMAVTFASFANANPVSKRTLSVSNFDEIEVSSAIDVVYEQSNGEYSVIAEIPASAESNFYHEQRGRTIKFWTGNNGKEKVKLYVKSPSLEDVELMGACSFTANSKITTSKLDVECSGAAAVNIKGVYVGKLSIECKGASTANISDISSGKVEVECVGSSSIILSGKTGFAEYEAKGACIIDASALVADRGEIEVVGSANLTHNTANVISLESAGMSTVKNVYK